MAKARTGRSGVTLLELVVVVTLMGILAAIGAARLGRSAFANFGSQGEARTLSLSMLRAERAAITTGDIHFIQFDAATPRAATQYNVMRRLTPGRDVLVEGPYILNKDVKVVATAAKMDFNFEGQAAAAYQVDFTGSGRNWRLNVVPITGAVVVTDVTP
ncbi:MAG: prepilin-type N-terminal cleavage/methylation domain-containing protein [Planctomycetota bacterium]|nr:prepilin-type N-terminal cleavage/methylation domain-containing protein [Planctomycetota bacterium]